MSSSPLPIGFAHRGGATVPAEQNTLAGFARAVRRGATAIESDVALTADGVPVLVHPRLRDRLGRSTSHRLRVDLPASVPSLEEVLRAHGGSIDIALDMAAPAAAERVVELARRHGDPARLWLTYWRVDTLAEWRRRFADVRLVYPTLLLGGRGGDSLRRLHSSGVDAVNLHHRACGERRIAAIHDHDMLVFAWGIRTGASARRSLTSGVDGVFCDDVPGMVAAVSAETARRAVSAAAGS